MQYIEKNGVLNVIFTAGVCVATSFVFVKILRNRKLSIMRKQWKDAPKDTVILHGFERGYSCPNLSPFVLKVETFLRINDIKYEFEVKHPFGNKGKSPWITLNGEDTADSEFIIERLKNHFKTDLDANLNEAEIAKLDAARILADEHLFWALILFRYYFDRSEAFLKNQEITGVMAFFFKHVMPKRIKQRGDAQGMGKHSLEEINQIAKKDLQILKVMLGDQNFFGGNTPCTADCGIFGMLAQLMWNAPQTDPEKMFKGDFPSLAEYCTRMKEKVFPDWDDLLLKRKK